MIIFMMQECEALLTLPLDGNPGPVGLPAPRCPQRTARHLAGTGTGVILGRVEDNPAWVTGSLVRAARERLEDGVTGL
ncbi:MAG: hypothetical protein ACRDOH_35665, partial [Streptosporangiaceae bacterium]